MELNIPSAGPSQNSVPNGLLSVEMGNVGQHYFLWRYPHLGQPWLTTSGNEYHLPIAFASKRTSAGHWETFTMDANGNIVTQVTSGQQETVPYSWRRSYVGGDYPRLMTDSRRDGGTRRLFSININNFADVRQHTAGSIPNHLFNPAVSPDGTQILQVMQIGESSALALQPFNRDSVFPVLLNYGDQQCIYQSPAWLPDGSGIVYAAACNGAKLALYHADLRYEFMGQDEFISAQLVNVRAITNTPTVDNYFPRVSPDGSKVVFSSNRNGQGDIYMINLDGSRERRLTGDAADDGAASWSRDGSQLVFDSNRDGDYEIYRMDLSAALPNAVQLTNNSIDDRWPLWYQ